MNEGSKILAIGAHPDDLTLGCYGTLLKAVAHSEVHVLSLSGRGTDQHPEFFRAFNDLATTIHITSMEPTFFRGANHEVRIIDELIEEHGIDVVISHAPWDHHRDHRVVAEMTETACRRRQVDRLSYQAISGTDAFQVNLTSGITRQWGPKMRALTCHKSMAHKPYMDEGYLKGWHMDKRAWAAGMQYVELLHVHQLWM